MSLLIVKLQAYLKVNPGPHLKRFSDLHKTGVIQVAMILRSLTLYQLPCSPSLPLAPSHGGFSFDTRSIIRRLPLPSIGAVSPRAEPGPTPRQPRRPAPLQTHRAPVPRVPTAAAVGTLPARAVRVRASLAKPNAPRLPSNLMPDCAPCKGWPHRDKTVPRRGKPHHDSMWHRCS